MTVRRAMPTDHHAAAAYLAIIFMRWLAARKVYRSTLVSASVALRGAALATFVTT